MTALHMAVWRGNLKIVKQLVRSGANVKSKDIHVGMTALHYAVYANQRDIARYLVEQDPECLEIQTSGGLTAYQMAYSKENREAIASDLKNLGAYTQFTSDEDTDSCSEDDNDCYADKGLEDER